MSDTKVMPKRRLVDEVARRSGPWGLTRRQVRDVLHGILDVITDEMAEGNAVTIAGFGRFEAPARRTGHGQLPQENLSPKTHRHHPRADMTFPTKDGIMPPN